MPKIHKYKNRTGFYIKSTVNGSITTYQVTEEGNNYLKSRGYNDQDEIDVNYLMKLKDWNYVYTYGLGPGDIDSKHTYFRQNNYHYRNKNRKTSRSVNDGFGCLLYIIFVILIFYIIGLIF